MIQINVLGNLGADAETKTLNGKTYLSLRVASTRKRNQQDVTTWVSVLASYSEKLVPYLVKGQSVFVSGEADITTYQKRDGSTGVDVSLFANILQLTGGAKNAPQAANVAPVGNNAPQQTQAVQTQNSTQIEEDLPF